MFKRLITHIWIGNQRWIAGIWLSWLLFKHFMKFSIRSTNGRKHQSTTATSTMHDIPCQHCSKRLSYIYEKGHKLLLQEYGLVDCCSSIFQYFPIRYTNLGKHQSTDSNNKIGWYSISRVTPTLIIRIWIRKQCWIAGIWLGWLLFKHFSIFSNQIRKPGETPINRRRHQEWVRFHFKSV